MSERVVRRVEDLEVFERAYRLSLELHQASLRRRCTGAQAMHRSCGLERVVAERSVSL